MNKIKLVSILLVFAIFIGVMAGCSPKEEDMPVDSNGVSDAVTDEQSTDGETEANETEAQTEDTEAATETTAEAEASTEKQTEKSTAETTTKKDTTTKKETTTKKTETTTKKTESTTKKAESTTKKAVTTTKKSETPTKGHTHSYTASVTKKATCTATGVKTYKCSCGTSYTESIPATGHNWKSETVHHDAVYGTRDITENWVHYAHYRHLYLGGEATSLDNQADMRKDELYFYKFGNKEFASSYTIKVAEVLIKESEYQQWITTWKPTASLQWVYRYNNSTTDISTMASQASSDFEKYCRTTFGNKGYGSYSDTAVKKVETKVVGTEKYVKEAAYDETIYTCTKCGSHK